MRTYFDLTSKEKDKYMHEFKKTPGGKKIFETRAKLIIFTLIIFIGILIMSIYIEETGNIIEKMERIENFESCMILITIVHSLYFNINFTFWLKNKYGIKRW